MGQFALFTIQELRAAGETVASIRESIDRNERFRIIRGWYGDSRTPADAVLAMRIGGRLGCVSALALHGAWSPPGAGTHVLFPTHASGRRSAGRPEGVTVVRHWHRGDRETGSSFGVAPLELAVGDVLGCQPPSFAIAILDSLLHQRRISRNRLEAAILRGPERTRHLVRHLEPRSESGIESIARYRIRMSGVATAVQVTLRTDDRIDLEIDDWLAIELDGREFHAQERAFTRDRVRVGRVMRQGRIVLQFAYATILYDWDFVLTTILEVMAQHAPVSGRTA
jgi:very-short-patch-repair endonuclease